MMEGERPLLREETVYKVASLVNRLNRIGNDN